MGEEDTRALLRRELVPDEYHRIREEWKTHSIAEDNRDIAGLISTLTPDCVYEIVPTVHRWEGHDGERRFYTELLTVFPDIRFHLTNIVIGPQGVWEEARVTATHQRVGLGFPATRGAVEDVPARRVWSGPKTDYLVGITPDGRQITYTDLDTGDIMFHDVGTGEARNLTRNPAPYDPGYGMAPRVSRDGR